MDPGKDQFWERSWQIITMWNPGLIYRCVVTRVTHGGLGSGSLPEMSLYNSGSRKLYLADGFRYLFFNVHPEYFGR